MEFKNQNTKTSYHLTRNGCNTNKIRGFSRVSNNCYKSSETLENTGRVTW